MEPHAAYDLELGSDRFVFLCSQLDATVPRADAAWSVDLLSGGFKFNDEIPDGLNESPELFLPLITLLRSLWAYRSSLVEGEPRADLSATWEWTRRLAPHWAGFAPDRCSANMQSAVDDVRSQDVHYVRDIERLEARWRRDGETGDDGADDGDMVAVDRRRVKTQ